ncbi:hypothetical protein [Natronosalvus halobius]|uniref:hypothetical protein n=1 Tax=Natronosalvus halobius TaxID=2953746 RepID=UPI0020A0E24E|nr:hypothetical protein [Natronosalvus halobius]USZ72707.1 hypothetical protein NGM15_05180 [Natronosalvus halobius]
MNRRNVLQAIGVGASVGLAGCFQGLGEFFTGGGIQPNTPILIFNEAEFSYNVAIEAQEAETGRKTYDEGINMIPGERAVPRRIERSPQQFRVTRHGRDGEDGGPGEDLVETGQITEETQLVSVRIFDDTLELEIIEDEDEAEAEQEELEEEANDSSENTSGSTDNEGDSTDNEDDSTDNEDESKENTTGD